jgi:Tol biopolymer transport system component
MKTKVAILLLVALTALAEQSLRQMFERARLLEEKNQNLEEAIQLYGQVVSQAKDQRALAAKAQLQIGLLHERLGRKTEALRAYHAVLNDYSDQDEIIRQARARIQAATGDPAGSMTVRQVWAGPGADYYGGISPDGSSLTYVDWDTGDLAVRNLATGEKRRLTNKGGWGRSEEFAEFSRVSPDGKQVAYTWYDGGTRFELRLMGFNGSNSRVLYRNEKVYHPRLSDWTPDGKHILAVLHYNQIVLISVADGSVRVLKTLERFPNHAMLSRDGRYVVYDHPQRPDAAERDICLFSLAAPQERELRLVEHPANDFVLGWTPDGKGLLFASERTGATDIWLLPLSEGRAQGPATLFRKDVGPITPIGFTRKGSFYYGVDTTLRDIYTAVIDPETGKLVEGPKPALQRHLGHNKYPAWSADGRRLAYLSERQEGNVLCIRSLDTEEEREFLVKLNNFRWPQWSPDGRTILATGADRKGRNGLFGIDAQTGEAAEILLSGPVSWNSQVLWSRDGQSVIYRGFDGKTPRFMLRNLQSGQETELRRGEVNCPALSPDGRQLAFAESGKVMLMPAEGGSARELLAVKPPRGLRPFVALLWTADGRHLLLGYADNMSSDTYEIWRMPVTGGELQKTGLAAPLMLGARLHPDGRRIAFVAGEKQSEVWAMENFLPVAGNREPGRKP